MTVKMLGYKTTHWQSPITLPTTRPITRIFFHNPTRTLTEVKKPYPSRPALGTSSLSLETSYWSICPIYHTQCSTGVAKQSCSRKAAQKQLISGQWGNLETICPTALMTPTGRTELLTISLELNTTLVLFCPLWKGTEKAKLLKTNHIFLHLINIHRLLIPYLYFLESEIIFC